MNQLTEQSTYQGQYTLHCYQVDEDTGNSKQTLFWAQHHAAAENKRDPRNGWAVVVGEWEAGSLLQLSAQLADRFQSVPLGQKSLSVKDFGMGLQALVDDEGKLQVNFLAQKPAAVSAGTETRWRMNTGSPEALRDLVSCFAAIAEAPSRNVAALPRATGWLAPNELYRALQG